MVDVRIAKFNGSEWSYRCAGRGPPLVWLHGLWGEPGWEAHHERLAENYTVYAPALPGYEGSPAPAWMIDMEDLATLLAEFLEALELKRPAIVGHSLGGWAAAELAVFRPASLRSLVLIDPLGIALDWTTMPNIFYCDPGSLPGVLFADASTQAARRYCPPPAEWDERFIVNRAASARLVFDPYLHSRKLAVRLRFATVPTLIIWGERDALISVAHAREWRERMPRASVSIVKGAGHLPHVERPEECMSSLLEFIKVAPTPEEVLS